MSQSASSSRKRRGRSGIVDIDENLEFLKSRLLQIREAIRLQYSKLNELQGQERNLKGGAVTGVDAIIQSCYSMSSSFALP